MLRKQAASVTAGFTFRAEALVGGWLDKWLGRALPRPDGTPPRRTIALLLAGAAAAVAGVVALTALMLWDAHRLVWEQAVRSSQNLAVAFEHDIKRNIAIYDLS